MQISEFTGKGGRLLYNVHNANGDFVARFDALDDAARVVRYITGANMGDDERQRAIEAMQTAQVARTLGRTLNAAKKRKKAAKATDGPQPAGA